jgi:hypothetical protein
MHMEFKEDYIALKVECSVGGKVVARGDKIYHEVGCDSCRWVSHLSVHA